MKDTLSPGLRYKAVQKLDRFSAIWCRNKDIEKEEDVEAPVFRCDVCPFAINDICLIKSFKEDFFPDYKGFKDITV